MSVGVLNRMIVAFGVTAAVLCGLNVPAEAQPQQARKGQETQQGKERQKAKQRAQQEQGKAQQALMDMQEQRLAQYRKHLDRQQRAAQKQSAQLQRQRRGAQYGYQQEYIAGLRLQQLRIRDQDRYDFTRELYLYQAPSYRYFRAGRYYETNQHGVDLLRQAVNVGYQQGRLAGLADQQDRWPFSCGDAYAYQDANYGYGGFHVDRHDYNTYFREGFRRGYDDGYYGRYQYGAVSDGRTSILGPVLGTILVFEALR